MADRQTLSEWTRRKTEQWWGMRRDAKHETVLDALYDLAAWLDSERAAAVVRGDIDPPGMEPFTDRGDQLVVDRGTHRPEYRSGSETIDRRRFLVVYVPEGQSFPVPEYIKRRRSAPGSLVEPDQPEAS